MVPLLSTQIANDKYRKKYGILFLKLLKSTRGQFNIGGRRAVICNHWEKELSDIVLKGRVNLRRMLGSVVLILFTLPIGFLPGRLYFFLFTIIGFIFLYFSLPIKLILNDSSLLIKRAFIEEPKQILIWEDVIETRETEVNEWKGFFNIVSNLFLFGWISLIVFRFKYKKITIIYGEYEEFHVSEYLIKNYETIEKTLADKKQHSSNDHT